MWNKNQRKGKVEATVCWIGHTASDAITRAAKAVRGPAYASVFAATRPDAPKADVCKTEQSRSSAPK